MKNHLKTLISTLNPQIYQGLSNNTYRHSILFLIILTLIFTIISGVMYGPKIVSFYSGFDENLGKLESVNTSITIQTNGRIEMLDSPKIVIDSTQKNTTDEFILITKDSMHKRTLFGYKTVNTKNFDIASAIKESKSKITIFLIFSGPTIFLLYWIFMALKALLIASFFSFIAFLIVKFREYNITYKQVFQSAVYSLAIYFILKTVLRFNYELNAIMPIVLYVIWYVITLVLMIDTRFQFNGAQSTQDTDFRPKRHKTRRTNNLDIDPKEIANRVTYIKK